MDPTLSFYNDEQLHTNFIHLQATGTKNIQCFAIYIPSHIHEQARFQVALEMLDIFYEKVMTYKGMKLILSKADALTLKQNEIGAMLTLEGCDAIGQDLIRLKTLYRLGVRSVGLTWNNANAVADGILEPRGAGITSFGKQVITFNNQHKLWTDVSHLSEKAFWDVIELAYYPIASHSNAKNLSPHVRNLSDNQIRALIEKNGMIGVTFVPEFLQEQGKATIYDVIRHVDYICSLGGENHIGFGSDFDGIEKTPQKLFNYSYYSILINELLKTFNEKIVKKILFYNFVNKIFF